MQYNVLRWDIWLLVVKFTLWNHWETEIFSIEKLHLKHEYKVNNPLQYTIYKNNSVQYTQCTLMTPMYMQNKKLSKQRNEVQYSVTQ